MLKAGPLIFWLDVSLIIKDTQLCSILVIAFCQRWLERVPKMIADRERILFALRLPAVLRVCLVAVLLGFCEDAIYLFVEEDLLKPIGASEKVELLFDSGYINGLRYDVKWKTKAVNAWRAHTKERNDKAKRRKNETAPTQTAIS